MLHDTLPVAWLQLAVGWIVRIIGLFTRRGFNIESRSCAQEADSYTGFKVQPTRTWLYSVSYYP